MSKFYDDIAGMQGSGKTSTVFYRLLWLKKQFSKLKINTNEQFRFKYKCLRGFLLKQGYPKEIIDEIEQQRRFYMMEVD